MTTAEGWIERWGLDGRMSKFRVQEAAQALRADAGAVREWADVARHTADGRVATNILRVLANLPVAVKRSVLGATYDDWADWAMRPDLLVRRALVLALLVDLHEPGTAAGPAAVAAAKSAERPERVSGSRARLCVRVRLRSLRRMPGHFCRRLRGARAVRIKFPLRPASSFCCGRKGGGRLCMCAGGAGSQLFSGVIRGDIPRGRRAGSPARGRWPRGC